MMEEESLFLPVQRIFRGVPSQTEAAESQPGGSQGDLVTVHSQYDGVTTQAEVLLQPVRHFLQPTTEIQRRRRNRFPCSGASKGSLSVLLLANKRERRGGAGGIRGGGETRM